MVIWLQTATVFWLGGGTIPLSCSTCMVLVMLGRQKYTAESLVPEPSAFEVELAIEKPKRHISPGTEQIPAELVKVGGRKIRSEIPKTYRFGIRRNA